MKLFILGIFLLSSVSVFADTRVNCSRGGESGERVFIQIDSEYGTLKYKKSKDSALTITFTDLKARPSELKCTSNTRFLDFVDEDGETLFSLHETDDQSRVEGYSLSGFIYLDSISHRPFTCSVEKS